MKAKVLFESTQEKVTTARKKQQLKDFPIIKCAEGEKILCVQRQHPIVLIAPMALSGIIALFVLSSLIFISLFLPQIFPFSLFNPTIIVYITLTSISTLLVIETFTFMTWYYQFYIITNKAIVYRHCFRLTGDYSESVFGENMHVQDINRRPINILYDFLKIQDVYVYFHKLEREEPFIFKTPDNAQEIDDILDDLIIQSNNKRKLT